MQPRPNLIDKEALFLQLGFHLCGWMAQESIKLPLFAWDNMKNVKELKA